MSDVNAFVDAIGKDIDATVSPQVEALGKQIGDRVKQVIDEQSVVVRNFATSVIQEVFQRYQPELAGELRTKIVDNGLEIVGQGVRLDLKRRDTGAVVSSLDVPVSLRIQIDGVSLVVSETTIGLDVVR